MYGSLNKKWVIICWSYFGECNNYANSQTVYKKKETNAHKETQIRLCFPSFGVLYQSLKHSAFKAHLIFAALSNANETEMNGNYGESTQCY